MQSIPDYITHDGMFKFNSSLDSISDYDDFEIEDVPEYDSFIVKPDDIEPELLESLAYLIDKNPRYKTKDGRRFGPSTKHRLLSSEYVAYVLDDNNIPIGVVTLVDPTVEDFDGIVPISRYSMKIGKSLKDRYEKRLLAVDEDHVGEGISKILEDKIYEIGDIYFVSNLDENDVSKGLVRDGYKLIGSFFSDVSNRPAGVWIK